MIVTASVPTFRKAYRRMQGFAEHEAGSSDTRAPVPPSTAGNRRGTPSPAPAVSLGSGPTDATRRLARSPLLAAKLYADVLGWPVAVQGAEVVVTCGGILDITTMPSDLGADVDRLLRVHGNPAPVMEVRGTSPEHPRSWAFVTASARADHDDTVTTLAVHRVDHFGEGAYIPLPPSPTNGRTLLRWLMPPSLNTDVRRLLRWETLAACTRRAVGLPVSESPVWL